MKNKLLYQYNEKPPLHILLFFSLQYVIIIVSWQSITAAIISLTHTNLLTKESIFSTTLICCGIVTFIQARGLGWFGAKQLLPPTSNPVYAGPSLLAVHSGGLSLLYGMTLFSGVIELLIAPFLRWIDFILPRKYIGAVIILIGIEVANSGIVKIFIDYSHSHHVINLFLALAIIIFIIFIQMRNHHPLKNFAYIIAIVCGSVIYIVINDNKDVSYFQSIKQSSLIQLPQFSALFNWHFNATIIVPFLLASLIASFKVICSISVLQHMQEKMPASKNVHIKGNLADGLGTLLSGLLGGVGVNVSSTCITLSAESNLNNKYVGYMTALFLILIAFCGKLMFLILTAPDIVIGALFVSLGATLLSYGFSISLQQITNNATDIIIFCLALVIGLSRGLFADFYNHLPIVTKMFTGSEIVTGAVFIIVANGIISIAKRMIIMIQRWSN